MFELDPHPHLAVLSILIRMPQRCGRRTIRIKDVSLMEIDENALWGSYLITPTRGEPKILQITYGMLRKVPRKERVYSCRFPVPPERLRLLGTQKSEREVWIALLAILTEGMEIFPHGEDKLVMGHGRMWMGLLGPSDMDELGLLDLYDPDAPLPKSVFLGLTVVDEFPEVPPHGIWSSLRKGKKQKGSRENPLLIPRERVENWLCPQRNKGTY